MSLIVRQLVLASSALSLALSSAALAQDANGAQTAPPDEAAQSTEAMTDAASATETPVVNEDEMADSLNSQQQLQQSFTFTRRINGEVVGTEKKTVTFDRNDPIRDTEAGQSALEKLRAEFDQEVLTRTEAFDEAKLDFVIADLDRDGQMTADEFARLVENWRNRQVGDAAAAEQETTLQQRYVEFLDEIDASEGDAQIEETARQKHSFMSGAAESISQRDYIREYMLDFDAMDANKDGLLQGDELLKFRAANRGKTLRM